MFCLAAGGEAPPTSGDKAQRETQVSPGLGHHMWPQVLPSIHLQRKSDGNQRDLLQLFSQRQDSPPCRMEGKMMLRESEKYLRCTKACEKAEHSTEKGLLYTRRELAPHASVLDSSIKTLPKVERVT